ncbi:ABC transporter substrate-binding protein [Anaerotignum sp.]
MKRILALLLTGAMAFSAAGCGAEDEWAEASTELNILMPEQYISDTLIDQFEEANNCTVNLSYMNDVAERVETMKNAEGEYDLVLVNDGYVAELTDDDEIRKFSHNDLANTSTINDSFWGSKSYCIPYLMKYVYVVYDTKACPVEITKYNDLLDPAMKGQFAVPEGERELFMMALATLGYAPNSVEKSEIEEAYDWLVKLKANEPVYGDVKQALLDGTVTAAVIDDRTAAEVMAKKKTVQIAPLTKDKIRVDIDVFVIPADAVHVDLAEKFLNYICDPEVTAANLEEYPYSSPNDVALTLVSKEYHKRPERQFDYPERVYFRKNISDAEDTYEEFYQKLNGEE